MRMTDHKRKIYNMLDELDAEECAEFLQWYIDCRIGIKGYCRT